MSFRILLVTITLLSGTALAQGEQPIDLENPRPLIMQKGYNLNEDFDDAPQQQTPAFMQDGKTSGNGDELTEHCRQLRLEYDRLKGKPQRRWALQERYKVECQAYFELHQ